MAAAARKIGLIVNPIAGMGGSTALKGTDGAAILARARALGAEPLAPARARRALARLAADAGGFPILAAPGTMGADVAKAAGFDVQAIEGAAAAETSAEDTRRVARALRERGVWLILFAGGDGTARDILDAVGSDFPILGIPAGVKMQSAVFAVSPEAAGQLAALLAVDRDGKIAFRQAEVMDIDEEGLRAGRLSARLYGYARVPFERRLMQNPKAGGSAEDATLDALCREIAEEMAPGLLYVIGPGTTTQRVLHHLGVEGSLLGVDAVLDGKLIGRDLTGAELARLVEGRPARIVLGIIGGQGYSFGRGNQQIGAQVIRAVGRENIILLASQQKILVLGENRLLADTGDPAVDELLRGYIRVRLAPGVSTMMRIDT
ncbi:MAG TPA: ATP-NAD kinase family protein [Verrucomicrobiae bacterium]|nr:ATP-NAD kinase family protein [Verrucomicrobiae bacterium]